MSIPNRFPYDHLYAVLLLPLLNVDALEICDLTGVIPMTALSDIPDNRAVRWDGTRFGLFPTLSDEAASIIPQGQSRIPALLEAIQSLHHFVTAHVLLTQITAIQYDSFPTWNGLQIDLQATGEVYIDPEQRYTLAKRWQLYFHTEPRPSTLPNN